MIDGTTLANRATSLWHTSAGFLLTQRPDAIPSNEIMSLQNSDDSFDSNSEQLVGGSDQTKQASHFLNRSHFAPQCACIGARLLSLTSAIGWIIRRAPICQALSPSVVIRKSATRFAVSLSHDARTLTSAQRITSPTTTTRRIF